MTNEARQAKAQAQAQNPAQTAANDHIQLIEAVRSHTRRALAAVGVRLARTVTARFGLDSGPGSALAAAPGGLAEPDRDALRAALAFAEQFAASQPPAVDAPPPAHPLLRLGAMPRAPATAALLEDLLLLACLPEAHEGYATLCRLLHPGAQPVPTAALALHWLEAEAADPSADPLAATYPSSPTDSVATAVSSAVATSAVTTSSAIFATRDAIEDLLCHSPLARMGVVRLDGDGPWHGRNLVAGPGVWAALMARAPALDRAELVGGYAQVPGLQDWLASPPVQQAIVALRRGLPCQILLAGGDAGMRLTRVRALLGAAGVVAIRARLDGVEGSAYAAHCSAAYTAAFMHEACLWLESRADADADPGAELRVPDLDWALPILCSTRNEHHTASFGLPLIRLPVQALAPVARRALWLSLLPQLGEQAGLLAARYPIDPDDARDVVRDLGLRQHLNPAPLALDQVGECIRARTSWHSRPGIQRVLPRADWHALLVPEAARQQLQSAVGRVLQQITVLDDWGFAQERAERRGVRMLFFGPPGTGKTLAAEVMARALGVDMLVVDLASLVSKWIGETEKNLAAVFDIAERSRALLLFDEADALFAKRTETQDAHDRYANLETAYLLQRLERYEGVAVLTTNLRSNLDKAFSRRFEYIVEFPEPAAATREALWRLHLPAAAPLAAGVDLAELAAWYTISGAQIKNAALTAAFFAAAAGGEIHQHHFLLAIEREFDKAGRAHPGFPPHTQWPADETATATPTHTTAVSPHAR